MMKRLIRFMQNSALDAGGPLLLLVIIGVPLLLVALVIGLVVVAITLIIRARKKNKNVH